jgi:lysozyme
MNISDLLLPLLRKEEGLRLTVYDDATGLAIVPGTRVLGHPTIGIGRALDVCGISSGEADLMLENDVAKVVALLNLHIPWWQGLSPNRQTVLAAMAFQMGVAGLLAFQNTLAAVQRGDYRTAAGGMLASRWASQTPARAKRMADMMENG